MILKKQLKSIPAVFLAAVLAVGSLCACGSGEKTTTGAPETVMTTTSPSWEQPSGETPTAAQTTEASTPEASAPETSAGSGEQSAAALQNYDPNDEEVRALLTEAELIYNSSASPRYGDFDTMKSLYEKAATKGSPLALYRSANILLANISDYELAEKYHDAYLVRAMAAASALPADNAEANLVFGLYFNLTGQTDRAIPCLEKAAGGDYPFSLSAVLGLADSYLRTGEYSKRGTYFMAAIEMGYEYAEGLYAGYLAGEGDYEQALIWYGKSAEDGFEQWGGLGNCYLALKRYDEAIEAYEQGLAGGAYSFAYLLGRCYYFRGEEGDAVKALEYFAEYVRKHKADPVLEGVVSYSPYEDDIKKMAKDLIAKGAVTAETVSRILGEDFSK